MSETNETTQTADNLEQFNQTEPKGGEQQPSAQQPAQPAAQPAPAQPAAQPAASQPADAYANLLEGIQVPTGVEVDNNAVSGLKDIAKKYNISVEAAREIMQLDLNTTHAQMQAEEAQLAAAHAKWDAENKAKYGDNLKNVETNCSRVLAELDKDGKFKELLALVGAEKHPATLGFLKTIGDLYLEKASVNPNATVSTDDESDVELENFN